VGHSRLVEELREGSQGKVEEDRPLAGLTTYRLGGRGAVYVEPAGTDDLDVLAHALERHDPAAGIPLLVLGRGSNVVISDHGWPGLVVRLGPAFTWIEMGEGPTTIVSGAATALPQLANWAARRSLAGLEWNVSIPGSVGGGVRMNAGAHGGAIADRLHSVRVWHRGRGVEERPAGELGLSYRRSNLGDDEIVIEARFTAEPGDPAAIKERMEAHRRQRAATQPGALQNAGSVFKNPEGDSAGRLVEAAGLKGFAVGGVSVSSLHANFFVAETGASAQEVHRLVHEVRQRVLEDSGIELTPEVRFIGRFDDE
jgi:UDP-N-acetylmuramate dehydrogenase